MTRETRFCLLEGLDPFEDVDMDTETELELEVEEVLLLMVRVSAFNGEDGAEGRRVREWSGEGGGGVCVRGWWWERERR